MKSGAPPIGPALLGNVEAHSPAMSSASGSGLTELRRASVTAGIDPEVAQGGYG